MTSLSHTLSYAHVAAHFACAGQLPCEGSCSRGLPQHKEACEHGCTASTACELTYLLFVTSDTPSFYLKAAAAPAAAAFFLWGELLPGLGPWYPPIMQHVWFFVAYRPGSFCSCCFACWGGLPQQAW